MIPMHLYFVYVWLVKYGWTIRRVEEHIQYLDIPAGEFCFDGDKLKALEWLRKGRNDK